MTIQLTSDDGRLLEMCRQALERFPAGSYDLVCGDSYAIDSSGDLHIWDMDPALLPARLNCSLEHQHVFLVDREELPLLRKRFPTLPYAILLKPITEVSLKSFLEQAIERYESAGDDRFELLQFMIEANVKLQEYDQERTNFLARAAHDFRAPLTALNGYCGLLLDGQLGRMEPRQAEVIERMRHSIKRLSHLSETMFDLRVRDRALPIEHFEVSELSECLTEAVHEIAPLIEEKRITLSIETEASPEPLRFDPSQMAQVFINLLDNARKFTPRQGLIEVRGYPFFWERRTTERVHIKESRDHRVGLNDGPNSYRVDIRDSGPGIPDWQLSTIFEEYTSFSNDQDRSGAGLGLAICKRILARHNGCVWADRSEIGSKFSFVLPFSQSSPDSPRACGIVQSC